WAPPSRGRERCQRRARISSSSSEPRRRRTRRTNRKWRSYSGRGNHGDLLSVGTKLETTKHGTTKNTKITKNFLCVLRDLCGPRPFRGFVPAPGVRGLALASAVSSVAP